MIKKERLTIEEINKCPSCCSIHLSKDYNRAELVCEDCGLVVDEDFIDPGPEWRAFDDDQRDKRSRVGSPMTYTIHDKGLSTTIGFENRDTYGKSIPTRNRSQLYRLRKWQNRSRLSDPSNRNLAIALTGLDRMASSLGLPRYVRETAAIVYRKAAAKKLIRGRSIEGMVAAALYGACRQCGVPRTLNEISNTTNMSRKDVGRNYRLIVKGIGLKNMPTVPEDYIARFCSELRISSNVQSKTMEILKEVEEKSLLSGRGPTVVAAASVYISSLICGERKTQREIADVAGVTEVSIRNRYKEIAEKLDIMLNF